MDDIPPQTWILCNKCEKLEPFCICRPIVDMTETNDKLDRIISLLDRIYNEMIQEDPNEPSDQGCSGQT